ncbi:phenylalanine ammonia-lyase [Mycena rosella]|uniref:Phenylalanine ammonia-lyase n=1 Tax=Mycena rosella TaxID=1033263 RepID=A0AAD7DGP7_MYCRO|nr:phenylalanine ammonia-lyase [Mycena rosella]
MGLNSNASVAAISIDATRNGVVNGHAIIRLLAKSPAAPPTLLAKFLAGQRESEAYRYRGCTLQYDISPTDTCSSVRNGKPIIVDGQTLSISAVAAAARHIDVNVELSTDEFIKERVRRSRRVISDKVDKGVSVYGLSTGFGGSGILPSSQEPLKILPLLDPTSSATMPEAWVRGAILIRMNSLIRGHSGIRWELIEKIHEILRENVIPVVPLRGSISASGDLSPLSYVAGLLIGNPSIRAFDGPSTFGARKMVSSRIALAAHNIEPISLASKEHLGILNGTAFSSAVASLALTDVVHLTLLAQVCTAMCTEALLGSRGSFDSFIHSVARPHPGQVECAQNIWNLLAGSKLAEGHEEEVSIEEDKHSLRQDRYPLRTSPQFIGPQIEDILSALAAVTQECNSTTDNPLVDPDTGEIHHGGNFQAMSVTNAMEKTRLALHHIGKIMFAQTAELLNPSQNRGLPPSLALTDPSLNYYGKGVDIAAAAYVSELGYLANPVSTHIQSAELHNQAVNNNQLLDVLTMLVASYLYVLCQAVDLRALQHEMRESFSPALKTPVLGLLSDLTDIMRTTLERTKVAASTSTFLLHCFTSPDFNGCAASGLTAIPAFHSKVAERGAALLQALRGAFLSGERGPSPASIYLGKTRPVYEFIRLKLNIKLHGIENYTGFANGLGVDDVTIGQNISTIYEAIRDGDMQPIVARLFDSI